MRYLLELRDTLRLLAIPLLIILVLVLAAALILLFPAFLSNHVSETSDRIALATLLIEAAGVVAILLAVWEFGQSQRGPRLRLHLRTRGTISRRTYSGFGVVSFRVNRLGITYLPFSVLVENRGKIPARWIQLRIQLAGMYEPNQLLKIVSFDRVEGRGPPTWTPLAGEGSYLFIGGADYVVYPGPSQVVSESERMNDIGSFTVSVKDPASRFGEFATLRCSIWADRSPIHEQKFILTFRQIGEEE